MLNWNYVLAIGVSEKEPQRSHLFYPLHLLEHSNRLHAEKQTYTVISFHVCMCFHYWVGTMQKSTEQLLYLTISLYVTIMYVV